MRCGVAAALAPELPGAGDLVGLLSRRGVTVSLGHTDADAAAANAAFDGGVLSLDTAVRALATLGLALEVAVDAATRVPSRLVPAAALGSLRPGDPADIAVLDDSLTVRRTPVGGVEVHAS